MAKAPRPTHLTARGPDSPHCQHSPAQGEGDWVLTVGTGAGKDKREPFEPFHHSPPKNSRWTCHPTLSPAPAPEQGFEGASVRDPQTQPSSTTAAHRQPLLGSAAPPSPLRPSQTLLAQRSRLPVLAGHGAASGGLGRPLVVESLKQTLGVWGGRGQRGGASAERVPRRRWENEGAKKGGMCG